MKKIKIIWILYNKNNIYLNIVREFQEKFKNYEIILVLDESYSNDELLNQEFNIKCIKTYKEFINFFFLPIFALNFILRKPSPHLSNFPYMVGLNKYLVKEKPNIVITNLIYRPYTWQAYRYCSKYHTKFILQAEVSRYPKSLLGKIFLKLLFIFGRRMFDYSNYITSWSEGSKLFLNQKLTNFPKDKIKLLPPGININNFFPFQRDNKSNKIKLLCVARFVEYKRHIDLFKAMKILILEKNLNLELSLIGSEDGYKFEILKQIDECGLKKYIKILQPVSNFQINEIYNNFDILILPSYNEAVGMVVPEAMAAGLPVIISDSVGAGTYVQNGINGYIFKTFDYEDLASKIYLLKDVDVRKKLSKNASNSIREKYSIEIITKKFYNLIKF